MIFFYLYFKTHIKATFYIIATTIFIMIIESHNITLGYKPVSTKGLSQFTSLSLSLWVKQPIQQ